MEITNEECLDQIRTVTGNFDERVNMDATFIDNLKLKLSEEGNAFRAETTAPTDDDITKQVIGRAGYYFHLTTEKTGAFFIWHDRVSKKFIFWGPDEYHTNHALGQIKYRIKIVTHRQNGIPTY